MYLAGPEQLVFGIFYFFLSSSQHRRSAHREFRVEFHLAQNLIFAWWCNFGNTNAMGSMIVRRRLHRRLSLYTTRASSSSKVVVVSRAARMQKVVVVVVVVVVAMGEDEDEVGGRRRGRSRGGSRRRREGWRRDGDGPTRPTVAEDVPVSTRRQGQSESCGEKGTRTIEKGCPQGGASRSRSTNETRHHAER